VIAEKARGPLNDGNDLYLTLRKVAPMTAKTSRHIESALSTLPSLRFEVFEAARILRMSRAQLYNRIHEGSIRPQKDGARTYITRTELERYVSSCGS
jgi:excisionase family DNA binding protein